MSIADNLHQTSGPLVLTECGDAELVRLLVAGNHEAMDVIFDRYYSILMRVALRIVRDMGEAEDVVSIAFTDFYRKAELFNAGKGNLRTWLLQYIYGRSINRLRRLKSRSHFDHVDLTEVDRVQLSVNLGSSFGMSCNEARLFVEQALQSLNEKHRRVIELICIDGLTIAETASMMSESVGNVQHSYYRSLEKLRAKFREVQVERRKGSSTTQEKSAAMGIQARRANR